MKIVQIGPYPLDENKVFGGIQTSIYGLSKVQKEKHEVYILDFPKSGINNNFVEKLNKLTIFRFKAYSKKSQSVLLSKKYLRIIRQIKPDVCHIHGTMLNSFCLWYLLRKKYKTIVTIHGLAHIEKKNLWRNEKTIKNLIQYLYQSITEFLFISICPEFVVDTPYVEKAIKQYYHEHKIFRIPTCHVIPQGIDESYYTLQNTPVTNRILSVGTLKKRKGRLQLIEAFSKVVKQFPDAKLIIAGGLSDEKYYQEMIALIKNLKIEESVEIIPNAILEEIQYQYSKASIFALHSEEESQGIVFCEAMAVGLSIVTTNVGGIPDVVTNNRNGLLSDYGDINTFSDNILQILKNREFRLKISNNNIEDSKKYSWHAIADKIEQLY
jgi:glycosyltransferase involved in cell wall biosynthesis